MLNNLNSGKIVNAHTFMLGTLGVKDEQGQPVMNELELQNPAASLLLNQLVGPLIKDFLPEQATIGVSTPVETPLAPGHDEEISRLQARLDELQRTLELQQNTIDELKGRRRPAKNDKS